jgi:hypothetical protein
VENIGFYSRLGLVPGPLTVTLVHDVSRRISGGPELLSAAGHQVSQRLEECRQLTEELAPGVDFTREITLTRDLGVGDTTLLRDGRELLAFALWHSTPLAAGRAKDEVRVLKLVARSLGDFERLLDALHGTAAGERVGRIAIRCQTEYAEPYLRLIDAGYRVHWTDLRMILRGFPQHAARKGVVLSNWEI